MSASRRAFQQRISSIEELFQNIQKIPRGHVASYGAMGRSLSNPTSGRIVGRWMAVCDPDLPWWRVVAKNGSLPTANRDPNLAKLQRQLLRDEGIELENDRIPPRYYIDVDLL